MSKILSLFVAIGLVLAGLTVTAPSAKAQTGAEGAPIILIVGGLAVGLLSLALLSGGGDGDEQPVSI